MSMWIPAVAVMEKLRKGGVTQETSGFEDLSSVVKEYSQPVLTLLRESLRIIFLIYLSIILQISYYSSQLVQVNQKPEGMGVM